MDLEMMELFVNMSQLKVEFNKIRFCIDLADASFLEPLSVVVHGLKRMNIFNKSKFKNKNVCIIGCGFLGLMLTEIIINNYSFNTISIMIERF